MKPTYLSVEDMFKYNLKGFIKQKVHDRNKRHLFVIQAKH